MKLSLCVASLNDAAAVADLLNKAAQHLTKCYGKGHWSYLTSERTVLSGMRNSSKVFIARRDDMIVGTLRLTAKKPWVIDPSYFTKVAQPVYLVDMGVHPEVQRKGVGKYMLQKIMSYAAAWPAQAIRLDAYNAAAGAGDFYRKCGFSERGHIVYRKVPHIYFELLLRGD